MTGFRSLGGKKWRVRHLTELLGARWMLIGARHNQSISRARNFRRTALIRYPEYRARDRLMMRRPKPFNLAAHRAAEIF